MLKPTVQVHKADHALVAEFWDCLRLDMAPVKELRSKYETHLRSNGRPMLVVDLLGVGFAGSSALGLFVTLGKLVRQKGGQIIFCNVDPTVHEVFRISKLDSMFEFVSDRPAALDRAARLDRDDDPGANPSPDPQPQPPAEPKPPRNSGNESLLRRHRRRNLDG
jgi:anti-anti-sigma factor